MWKHLLNVMLFMAMAMTFTLSHGSTAPVCEQYTKGSAASDNELLEEETYSTRADDYRCEGLLFLQPKSRPDIEVRSIFRGSLSYSLRNDKTGTNDEKIIVSVPKVNVNKKPIEIVSRRLVDGRPYYQMRTLVEPGDNFSWAVKTVLLPNTISAKRLGITAHVLDENSVDHPVYLPIVVSTSSKKASVQSEPLLVRLLTHVKINSLEVYELCDGKEKKIPTRLPQGSIVEFRLSDKCKGNGRVVVSVESKANDGEANSELEFYVPR